VLDRLSGNDEPGVENRHPAKLLYDFRTLISDAVDGLAGLSTGRLADDTEDAVEALDLALGLPKVLVVGRSTPPKPVLHSLCRVPQSAFQGPSYCRLARVSRPRRCGRGV
jgi:hypothetical protein